MGVSADHVRQNHGNEVLLEGSRKLGYHSKPVPQNTGGKEHYCGHCSLGCGSAQKQGPVVSWLPDAAKAGAKFIEGFQVERVLFHKSNRSHAIGVEGTWTSRNSKGGVDGPFSERTKRKIIVKAKKVVLSSGTLWSPIILMNSGLKVSDSFSCQEAYLTLIELANRSQSLPPSSKYGCRGFQRRCPTMGRRHINFGLYFVRKHGR